MSNPLKKLKSRLCSPAVVALLLVALGPGTVVAAESEIMPLAERSLLLDGQVLGERIVVVGERGHILISEDQGHSWQQQPVPTRATLTSVYFIDPAYGWAAGHDAVILKTLDGGRHWEKVYSDPEDYRPVLDLWFHDQKHGYAIGAYGLFLATGDGGKSWSAQEFAPATFSLNATDHWAAPVEDSPWGIDYHLNQMAATPTDRLYIAAEAGHLYRSDDGCRSWLSLPSPYEGSFYGTLPLDADSLLLFGLRGHLFRSDNAGMTWQELETGTQATLNDAIHLQDGRIVVVGLAGTVLISDDEGQSFALHAQPDRLGIAKVLEAPDGALLLLGEGGVRRIALPQRDIAEDTP